MAQFTAKITNSEKALICSSHVKEKMKKKRFLHYHLPWKICVLEANLEANNIKNWHNNTTT